jgi:hypothetical protein
MAALTAVTLRSASDIRFSPWRTSQGCAIFPLLVAALVRHQQIFHHGRESMLIECQAANSVPYSTGAMLPVLSLPAQVLVRLCLLIMCLGTYKVRTAL